MNCESSTTLFDLYRRSLTEAGIATIHEDSLVCPLCWYETRLPDLSVEHVVPGSVGGTATVLTCRKCNNEQGSSLDAHLAKFQATQDAFKGHGTIPTELTINGKRLVANLEWLEGSKNFRVVAEATDPRMQELVQADFRAGTVGEFSAKMSFGYAKNRFQGALVRAAYLALFKRFGYEYANHDNVHLVRRRICDPSLETPSFDSIIIRLESKVMPDDYPYLITGGDADGVPFFLVIIRVKKKTITYMGVCMPHPNADSQVFFDHMEQCLRENDGKSWTIPAGQFFT